MAAFAITQVVLDEATLFQLRSILIISVRDWEGRCWDIDRRTGTTLWLEVRASNAAAIALYEGLGFNEATIRLNYYPTTDGREDAIIMALPISM